jgi:ribonucleoside-diphosphate reductase alpha chain
MRRRLNDTRESITHKFNVAGHEGYLIAGLYEDGRPGELFITMAKEGSTIGGLMDSLGTAVSVALQYGVPVESLVTKFAHQRFEPMGMTTNSEIPFAKSLVDYIFRWLGMQFIPGYREANAPRRAGAAPSAEPLSIVNPAASPRKEDDSCANGTGTKSVATDWSARREAVIEAAAATRPTPSGSVISSVTETIQAVASVERIAKGVVTTATAATSTTVTVAANALDQSNAALMGDAPACDVCGAITVRNGTCYRCLNCGNSMGCS